MNIKIIMENRQKNISIALELLNKFSNDKKLNMRLDILRNALSVMKVAIMKNRVEATMQKFYFNSSLTSLKVLWMFKTINEKEKERNVIPQKTIMFINTLTRVFEFNKIRKEREYFSLLNKTSDEHLDKLFEIVNMYKKIASLKLIEFIKNYAYRNKNTKQIKGALIIQSYNNKMINYAFLELKKLIMDIRNKKSKKNSILCIMLVYAQEKKLSIALKAINTINNKYKQRQKFLSKIASIFYIKSRKVLKDGFALIYLRGNIIKREKNYKNVIYPLALQKLQDCMNKHINHLKEIPFKVFEKNYLLNKQAKASLIVIMARNAKIKQSIAFRYLSNLLYDPKSKKAININFSLTRILNKNYKYAFDKIIKEAEIAVYKGYYNDLWKRKINALETENYSYKEKSKAEMHQLKIKNASFYLNRIFKENALKSLMLAFRILMENKKKRTLLLKRFDNNKVIADTIKFANFCKLLLKKSQIMTYKAFCIWRDMKYTPKSIFNFQMKNIGNNNAEILRLYNITRVSNLHLLFSNMIIKRKRITFSQLRFVNKHADEMILKAFLSVVSSLFIKTKIKGFHRLKILRFSNKRNKKLHEDANNKLKIK